MASKYDWHSTTIGGDDPLQLNDGAIDAWAAIDAVSGNRLQGQDAPRAASVRADGRCQAVRSPPVLVGCPEVCATQQALLRHGGGAPSMAQPGQRVRAGS